MKKILKRIILVGVTFICMFSFISCRNQLTISGYLIDSHCSEKKSGRDETIKCLQMKDCESAGYGVDVFENDTKKFIKFDDNGHKIAKDFIASNSEKEKLGEVIITGEYSKDIFIVNSIKFKD